MLQISMKFVPCYQMDDYSNFSDLPLDLPLDEPKEGCDNPLTCANKGWCWPVWIYLGLSLLALLGFIWSLHTPGATVTYALLFLVVIIFTTWLLYVLCKSGHVMAAWILLFLPLIIEIVWIVLVATVTF